MSVGKVQAVNEVAVVAGNDVATTLGLKQEETPHSVPQQRKIFRRTPKAAKEEVVTANYFSLYW